MPVGRSEIPLVGAVLADAGDYFLAFDVVHIVVIVVEVRLVA